MPESPFELSPAAIDAPASAITATSVVVPVGIEHRVETLAGVPVTVDVLAGDSSGSGDSSGAGDLGSGAFGSIVGFGAAARGTVGLVGPGLFRYVPQRRFTGVDYFSVALGNGGGGGGGSGGRRTIWVEVRVWAVNTPPLAAADLVLIEGDGPVTIDVMGNDRDPDGDALKITGFGMPAHGTLQVNADQTFTYWPDPGFLLPDHSGGQDSFRYTIRDLRGEGDGQVGFAEAQVTLARPVVLPPPNNPPIVLGERVTTPRDTAVSIDILGNDSDMDGDPLRVAALTVPLHGSVVLEADNSVSYTPAADFIGIDDFTYVIEDGRGGRDMGIVVLEVIA